MPESINGSKNGWTWSECESLGFCVDELLFVSPERLSMALKQLCFQIIHFSYYAAAATAKPDVADSHAVNHSDRRQLVKTTSQVCEVEA